MKTKQEMQAEVSGYNVRIQQERQLLAAAQTHASSILTKFRMAARREVTERVCPNFDQYLAQPIEMFTDAHVRERLPVKGWYARFWAFINDRPLNGDLAALQRLLESRFVDTSSATYPAGFDTLKQIRKEYEDHVNNEIAARQANINELVRERDALLRVLSKPPTVFAPKPVPARPVPPSVASSTQRKEDSSPDLLTTILIMDALSSSQQPPQTQQSEPTDNFNPGGGSFSGAGAEASLEPTVAAVPSSEDRKEESVFDAVTLAAIASHEKLGSLS